MTGHQHAWFQQTQAQYNLPQIIADATKYFYAISTLDQDTAQRVVTVGQNSPVNGKCTDFKNDFMVYS